MEHRLAVRLLGIAVLVIVGLVAIVISQSGVKSLIDVAYDIGVLVIGGLGTIALQMIIWPERFLPKGETRETAPAQTVEVGGKALTASNPLYELDGLPDFEVLLKNAKKSVSISGGNLVGLRNSFAEPIREYAGTLPMKFLVLDPDWQGTKEMEASDTWKDVKGAAAKTIETLCRIRNERLPKERYDEFQVRIHRHLPLSMIIVDREDRASSSIQMGVYFYGVSSTKRPQVLVSPKSPIYDNALKMFDVLWKDAQDPCPAPSQTVQNDGGPKSENWQMKR